MSGHHEEMACHYIEQVAAAIDAAFGEPGEWGRCRAREAAARDALRSLGATFSAPDRLGPMVCIRKIPAGEHALAWGVVLHHDDDLAAQIRAGGVNPADVVDDEHPQITVPCVGMLGDGRAVGFYAMLTVAEAIGTVPPDHERMAESARMAGLCGELEWWWA